MEYFNKFTEYTGEQFNKIVNDNALILVKVLNDKETLRGFRFNEGLNIDTNEFNPNGKCEKGGLYFTDCRYLIEFYENYGKIIRLIEIPNDARVYIENKKYKADKIILNEKFTIIEEFYKNYVNSKEIYLKIVKTNGMALKYVHSLCGKTLFFHKVNLDSFIKFFQRKNLITECSLN
jgi:hypothetical protein